MYLRSKGRMMQLREERITPFDLVRKVVHYFDYSPAQAWALTVCELWTRLRKGEEEKTESDNQTTSALLMMEVEHRWKLLSELTDEERLELYLLKMRLM